jgi:hypothetical protein
MLNINKKGNIIIHFHYQNIQSNKDIGYLSRFICTLILRSDRLDIDLEKQNYKFHILLSKVYIYHWHLGNNHLNIYIIHYQRLYGLYLNRNLNSLTMNYFNSKFCKTNHIFCKWSSHRRRIHLDMDKHYLNLEL